MDGPGQCAYSYGSVPDGAARRRSGVKNGGGTARDVVSPVAGPRPRVSLTPGSGEGVFRQVSGNGTVSPDGEVSGTVTVAAASIDTSNTRRDTHLRSADFFDSGNHPDITFTADGIRPCGQGVAVTGALTVRGRTRRLYFDAAMSVRGNSEIWLDAEVRINRADFGLAWNVMGLASVNNPAVSACELP